jgi:hypothetical protein
MRLLYLLQGVLEAATVILSHYFRRGERLYTDGPLPGASKSIYFIRVSVVTMWRVSGSSSSWPLETWPLRFWYLNTWCA